VAPTSRPEQGLVRWILLGALLGVGAILLTVWLREGGLGGGAFEEVEQYFPRIDAGTLATWTDDWHRKGDRWSDVPDPPGRGEVVRARYWLARDRYDMEVRRRGDRFVVVIAGVAEHLYGGGWAAFGEGRVTGDARDFRGAVATFAWSCLGLRYRHASDGLGRLVFSADGRTCHAIYMAWEAPELWAKSYGRRHEVGDERPDYGAFRGQIPIAPALPRLEGKALYRTRVRVTDPDGTPLAGAVVQLKGHGQTRVQTDASGEALVAFRGAEAPYAQSLCAGLSGYRNGEYVGFTGDAEPGLDPGTTAEGVVVIRLTPLDPTRDPGYAWNHASAATDPDDVMACGTCHPWHYDQWYDSRHARAADSGHVTWEREQMVREDPLAVDDCRGCHQPAYALDALDRGEEPTWQAREPMAGNHCDFCHKIEGLRDVRESGVLGAYSVLRPDARRSGRPGGIHVVFGPSADATYAYMGAAYNPLFQSSHLCAGCHQGGGAWRNGGPPKIDTFGEWKLWASSRPNEEFRSCLDCHMPGAETFDKTDRAMDQMAWDALHRSPQDVHSHRFLGSDTEFAQHALEVSVEKQQDPATGAWTVEVAVSNDGAGHKVPTGTWTKHVVVGVWAEVDGRPLRQLDGDRAWLDPGAPDGLALAPGDWRNPGGLVLGVGAVVDAGLRPSYPRFWQAWPADQLVDTRLSPGETRRARCRFEATPAGREPDVEVRILHRRGALPGGAASVPWTLGPYDPQPEVLWQRIRR